MVDDMVSYCNDCKRYVNQFCEICSGNFGIAMCERFGCGGRMVCPICAGNNLTTKREDSGSSYDFSKQRRAPIGDRKMASDLEARYFAEKRDKENAAPEKAFQGKDRKHCPLCGYGLDPSWKFCPECGVSLLHK
jgi:hypothetical protein